MHILVLSLSFRLHACASLKEKRSRLSGLRDKFGAQKNIAVCESGDQDQWQKARWEFVVVGQQKGMLEKSVANIVEHSQHNVDAELIDHQIEWL